MALTRAVGWDPPSAALQSGRGVDGIRTMEGRGRRGMAFCRGDATSGAKRAAKEHVMGTINGFSLSPLAPWLPSGGLIALGTPKGGGRDGLARQDCPWPQRTPVGQSAKVSAVSQSAPPPVSKSARQQPRRHPNPTFHPPR